MNRTGMVIQPNKAIVGANAFAHESGIHQDGVLKHKETYEIIQPETIGKNVNNNIVLGKHSGRNAFFTKIGELVDDTPYSFVMQEKSRLEALFIEFKKLCDIKKGITDADIFALIESGNKVNMSTRYELESLNVVSGTNALSTATICLIDHETSVPEESASINSNNDKKVDAAIGHGAVHAIFSCINRITRMDPVLVNYDVKSVTEGSDSLGKVTIRLQESQNKGKMIVGYGTDEDVLIASAKAYLEALNRMIWTKAADM